MILIEPTIKTKFGRALRTRALGLFLEEAAVAVRLPGAVSVLLTSDAEIRRLNREFRHKDKATDVLSFPAIHHRGHRGRNTDRLGEVPEISGDLAISVETAARQAEEFGHALATELQILVLHGLLHLGGFDHETDDGGMARKEARLRRKFGLAAGLIERSGTEFGAAKRGGGR